MKENSVGGRIAQYGALLLLVQLTVGCSQETPVENTVRHDEPASAPATSPVADAKIVVAFGDSLFAGYSLAQDRGFAPRLQQALEGRGVKARVVNAGVSGDTTDAGLQRLDFTLDGLPRKPDLVIVGLGGNDMLRGLSPEATRSNLDAIMAKLKQRGIHAMMTGMLAAPNMGPDYAARFNPIYPDLASKYGVALYPFFLDGVLGHRDLQLPDGIHPNDRGVDIVVAKITPLVQDQLDK
jgi:acyl-CoA thioesterase-1